MGAHTIAAMGIVQVPEGRRIFGRLTVSENLDMGAFKDAEREFQSCLAREGQGLCAFMDERESAVLVPPVLYGLARAKESQHEPDAMAAYRSFLARTTGADDPLVRDAQRRLGAL